MLEIDKDQFFLTEIEKKSKIIDEQNKKIDEQNKKIDELNTENLRFKNQLSKKT